MQKKGVKISIFLNVISFSFGASFMGHPLFDSFTIFPREREEGRGTKKKGMMASNFHPFPLSLNITFAYLPNWLISISYHPSFLPGN